LEMMHRSLALMPLDAHDGLDHAVIHGNLALTYIDAKRPDEALHHAQRSLTMARLGECEPLIGQAHTILAAVHEAAGELDAAYAQLATAREYTSGDGRVMLSANIEFPVGQLLAREGRPQEAVEAWERAYDVAVRGEMIDFAITILNRIRTAHET